MQFHILTISVLLVSTTYAAYQLVDDYPADNFAGKFDFFTGDDPTHGYVNYVDQNTASRLGLFKQQGDKIYIGVDSTHVTSSRGRNSVRISSKTAYNHGLFILDLAHIPDNQCGSWPAFWTFGPNWPNSGEIDIIEGMYSLFVVLLTDIILGVNTQNTNAMTLHTSAGCSITNTHDFTGNIVTSNCDVNAAGQPTNAGCGIRTNNTKSYGSGFNNVGGGVYGMEWTSAAIRIWFFPRSEIPSDIVSSRPDPNNWGLPLAKFSGCDIDSHFRNHNIIFDITFCGDWAGNVWSEDPVCASRASSCIDYVRNNPTAFNDVYWLINSLKVYQNNGEEDVEIIYNQVFVAKS